MPTEIDVAEEVEQAVRSRNPRAAAKKLLVKYVGTEHFKEVKQLLMPMLVIRKMAVELRSRLMR